MGPFDLFFVLALLLVTQAGFLSHSCIYLILPQTESNFFYSGGDVMTSSSEHKYILAYYMYIIV